MGEHLPVWIFEGVFALQADQDADSEGCAKAQGWVNLSHLFFRLVTGFSISWPNHTDNEIYHTSVARFLLHLPFCGKLVQCSLIGSSTLNRGG